MATMNCDYLVVGAGAASIAFIDTLLTEIPSAKIILVDKKEAPGGHWVDAYGFVHLHQPSLLYGVASRQLEGNWMKLMLLKCMLPWRHRASKKEILHYFQKFVDDKVSSGQLKYFPKCEYNFSQEKNDRGIHSFNTMDGKTTHRVSVEVKLVNGILGECKIPSQCPVSFPVDKDIPVFTPNKVYDMHRVRDLASARYVVLGAGKTAMDTVVYLQRYMKLKPENIYWVIPNDVWMLAREGSGNPWSWPQALLESKGDKDKACLNLEKDGAFVRLDKNVKPTRFRFPMIGKDELSLMRKIPFKNLIRRGRVTKLRHQNETVVVEFGTEHDPWVAPQDATFVHCTSPGPFNGNEIDGLFLSDKEMNLNYLFAPPVSISMSCLAFLEAARRNNTLDTEFGMTLVQAAEGTLPGQASPIGSSPENEQTVLESLFRTTALTESSLFEQFRPIINLALILCLVHSDPLIGHKWMKENRLSFLSIPGFKCKVYENLGALVKEREALKLSEGELSMITLLRNKLEPLEGN